MKSLESLQHTAREHGLHQGQAAYEAGVELDADAGQTRWNRASRRSVFEQTLHIWAEATQIEVLLDAENQPLGFVDRGGWAMSEPAALDDAALLRAIEGQGQSPSDIALELVSRRIVEHGAVEALLRPRGSSGAATHRAVVNPSRELLVALLPAEVEP